MKQKRRVKTAGFTMIELMAVLIILGLLFAIVARSYVGHTDKARQITTMANLKQLHQAVQQFMMDTGRYPTEEEGLQVLIEQPPDVANWQPGGYLDTSKLPVDGWGRPFIYERVPGGNKPFVIKSLGADGQEGGEGYDRDLLSTDPAIPTEVGNK